jgi:hypothetical protein
VAGKHFTDAIIDEIGGKWIKSQRFSIRSDGKLPRSITFTAIFAIPNTNYTPKRANA